MSHENVFGKLVDRLVHERYRSAARFAEALRAKRLEISESKISRIIAGVHPPQLDELSTWVDALGLSGDDAREFRIEAELAKLRQLEDLKDSQASACEAIIDELKAAVEKLTKEHHDLRIRYDAISRLPRASRRP